MACPTCSHTMHVIFCTDSESVHTCPRCGTTKVHRWDGDQPEDEHEPKVYVPKLVERCREFGTCLDWLPDPHAARQAWRNLGIAESINVPERRT